MGRRPTKTRYVDCRRKAIERPGRARTIARRFARVVSPARGSVDAQP